MKNRHRVSQAVSKLICSRAARRKNLKRVRQIAANIAKLPGLFAASSNPPLPAAVVRRRTARVLRRSRSLGLLTHSGGRGTQLEAGSTIARKASGESRGG
jgi:hypothetical protein